MPGRGAMVEWEEWEALVVPVTVGPRRLRSPFQTAIVSLNLSIVLTVEEEGVLLDKTAEQEEMVERASMEKMAATPSLLFKVAPLAPLPNNL